MKKLVLLFLLVLSQISFAQWEEISNQLDDSPVQSIAIQGSNIFTGTMLKVFLSTDDGNSWVQKNITKEKTYISTMIFKDTSIIIGTYTDGIYVSNDLGNHWYKSYGLLSNCINTISLSGDRLWVGTNFGVYYSTNNGNNWEGEMIFDIPTIVYSVNFNATKTFLGTDRGLLIYTKNIDPDSVVEDVQLSSTPINCVNISGNKIIAGTSIGAFFSSDNGTNWNEKNNGLRASRINTFVTADNFIFAGTNGGGFYVSTFDNSDWQPRNTGLTTSVINFLLINGNTIFAGTEAGLFKAKLTDLITQSPVFEDIDKINISIYPNPAFDFIEISDINPMLKHGIKYSAIKIYNVFGQTVSSTVCSIDNARTSGGQKIDVSDLASGIYFIQIGENVQKFIKL